MKAVFKHEVSSYFTGLSGYVFGAFLLLFTGIYVMIYNVNHMITNFEFVITSISFVFLIIVPILTMKVIAEERKQKTDQLLYSLPVGIPGVVIGKFLALLVILLIPLGIICIYPLWLKSYGDVYLLAAYNAIFAFFLLGMSLLAIGMFISSICESQTVAAGICFVVMLINYFIAALSSYVGVSAIGSVIGLAIFIVLLGLLIRYMTGSTLTAFTGGIVLEAILVGIYVMKPEIFVGLLPRIMERLSLFERFYIFVDGVFDVSGVIYFLSVTVVFVFLTIQSLEKRRWS